MVSSAAMAHVRLIHWNADEAAERQRRLEAAGHHVDVEVADGAAAVKAIAAAPPDAVVIDLSRLPSHGLELGKHLRRARATRGIPLVFVDGEQPKVERVRGQLPDATFASWPRIAVALKTALRARRAEPSEPLAAHLGIRPGWKVGLVGAPDGFVDTLGALPDGARARALRGACDLLLWFARDLAVIERDFDRMAGRAGQGGLWVIWPKGGAAARGEPTQVTVRAIGLAHGHVDYKAASIDATWTGLRFRKG